MIYFNQYIEKIAAVKRVGRFVKKNRSIVRRKKRSVVRGGGEPYFNVRPIKPGPSLDQMAQQGKTSSKYIKGAKILGGIGVIGVGGSYLKKSRDTALNQDYGRY